MFKIESYVTSIILANAEKYIKNLPRQDAQVSLWGGDAEFYNIDLNEDALNEEYPQLPFVFTSGHIHKLNIHVPWTKLTSEAVTISVNTIECVVKLKANEDVKSSQFKKHRKKYEDIPQPSTYISSLTAKIMHNLSVKCTNVILKLLEEDIVLSTNIQKLSYDNVDGFWKPSFTEINLEAVRKTMNLSGVTVCLDKQNSSGRIENYLDPLLYRCALEGRILNKKRSPVSKKQKCTTVDVCTDKMLFTISEPQISMLMKLWATAVRNFLQQNHQNNAMGEDSRSSKLSSEATGEIEGESWSNWLWNSIPPFIYEDEHAEEPAPMPTYTESHFCNMGLYVNDIEIAVKLSERGGKKVSKVEYREILLCSFFECFLCLKAEQSKWCNYQGGVGAFKIGLAGITECFAASRSEPSKEYLKGSLFGSKDRSESMENELELAFENKTNVDFNFSLSSHLNDFSENALLEKSPAFAMDDLRYELDESKKLEVPEGVYSEKQEKGDSLGSANRSKGLKESLTRFVVGPAVVNCARNALSCWQRLTKCAHSDYEERKQTETDHFENVAKRGECKRRIQFTFFDFEIRLYSDAETCFLLWKFKCLDGNAITTTQAKNVKKETYIGMLNVTCDISSGMHQHRMFQGEKLEIEFEKHDEEFSPVLKEINANLGNVSLICSKPELCLAREILTENIRELDFTCWDTLEECDYYYCITSGDLDGVKLEFNIGELRAQYKMRKEAYAVKFIACECATFILKDGCRKCIILSSTGRDNIKVMVQNNFDELESQVFPRCAIVTIREVQFCTHPLLFEWLAARVDFLRMEKQAQRLKELRMSVSRKISCETSAFRKVSSGYSKPEESVHGSSSEQDGGNSNSQQAAAVLAAPTEGSEFYSARTTSPELLETTSSRQGGGIYGDYYNYWCNVVVFADASQTRIYVPCGGKRHPFYVDGTSVEESARVSLKEKAEVAFLVWDLDADLKCFVPKNLVEELTSNSLLFSLPSGVWSPETRTLPWTFDLKGLSCAAMYEDGCRQVLEPVEASIQIAASKGENSLGLILHFDVKTIGVFLDEKLMVLTANMAANLREWTSKNEMKNIFGKRKETKEVPGKSRDFKLTTWAQCTLTKFTGSIRGSDAIIEAEAEDVILSVDFKDVYHKIIAKIAQFSIRHFQKMEGGCWMKGPFGGILLQRGGGESGDSNPDRRPFLSVILTRALSSNLIDRLVAEMGECDDRDAGKRLSDDSFVTEIIVKTCPVDAVLPCAVLSDVSPVFQPFVTRKQGVREGGGNGRSAPFLYIDVAKMNVFIPCQGGGCDTLCWSMECANLEYLPGNPMVRKELHPCSKRIDYGGNKSRQYQLTVKGLRADAGSFQNLANMLEGDGEEEKSSVDRQNPALMWNQGCNLERKKTGFSMQTQVVSNFTIRAYFSLPFVYKNAVLFGHEYEADISCEIDVTINSTQIRLLKHLSSDLENLFGNFRGKCEEEEHKRAVCKAGKICGCEDSGVDSMDQSSVESSTLKKNGGASKQIPSVHYGSVRSEIASRQSLPVKTNPIYSAFVPKEVVIAAKMIRISIYECEGNGKVPLFRLSCNQPLFYYSDRNSNSGTYQLSIFEMSWDLAEESASEFSRTLFYTKKTNKNHQTGVSNSASVFNAHLNFNQITTAELILNQPVVFWIDVSLVKCLNRLEKSLQTMLGMNAEECCEEEKRDSKPFARNLSKFDFITREIFLTLSTKNNNEEHLLLALNSSATSVKWVKYADNNIYVKSGVKCVTLSVLRREEEQRSGRFRNAILKPWNFEIDLAWDVWREVRFKLFSESLVLDFNPRYVKCLRDAYSDVITWGYQDGIFDDREMQFGMTRHPKNLKDPPVRVCFKDDLRAGAFQFGKMERNRPPHPCSYEIVFFAGKSSEAFMCWKYPQPRVLSNLLVYPVPIQMIDDRELELHCQLQHYDEMSEKFLPYGESFKLSEKCVQNIPIPQEKASVVSAACWRILMYTENTENCADHVDVSILAGCVRVDSIVDPNATPKFRLFADISCIRMNFSTLGRQQDVNFDGYIVYETPEELEFLRVYCEKINATYASYINEKLLNISATLKADVLNYEYVMFQSVVEPFSAHVVVQFIPGSDTKCTIRTKNVKIRASPSFTHAILVSKASWMTEEGIFPARYAFCNNTNFLITIHQKGTSDFVNIDGGFCSLYAWSDPTAPKLLIFSTLHKSCRYESEPMNIKTTGRVDLKCFSDGDFFTLFVRIKRRSFTHQIILEGHVSVYNATERRLEAFLRCDEEMDDGSFPSPRLTLGGKCWRTILTPDQYRFSVKVRLGDDAFNWSGFIPVVTAGKDQPNNQSYIVKVRLPRGGNAIYYSICCQIMRETNKDGRILVVFKPLCSVRSFLPCASYIAILHVEKPRMKSELIGGRGCTKDLLIYDVAMNDYSLEWKPRQTSHKRSTICLDTAKAILPVAKGKTTTTMTVEQAIEELDDFYNKISCKWPCEGDFLRISWKWTPENEDFSPILAVKKGRKGSDVTIDIYAQVLFLNTLGKDVSIAVAKDVYHVGNFEAFVPPFVEEMFKLALTSGGTTYLSGSLQLCAAEEVFPMPKVAGRIPTNGFVSVTMESESLVSYLNIESKKEGETRVIGICSSYVLQNSSSERISWAAYVVCRSEEGVAFDVPRDEDAFRTCETSTDRGCPIVEWRKVGAGEARMLPYIVIKCKCCFSCPIRICSLSEQQAHPIDFSTPSGTFSPPCLCLTARQKDGKITLTVWDDTPLLTVHNATAMSLDVCGSKCERGEPLPASDWNWKLNVGAGSRAHFNTALSAKSTHLLFAICVPPLLEEDGKWSQGVPLTGNLSSHYVSFPFSQQQMKISTYRDGLAVTYFVETAIPDEFSAKIVRSRLSQRIAPEEAKAISPDSVVGSDEIARIPHYLHELYNRDSFRVFHTNVYMEGISVTLAGNDDSEGTEEEIDVGTFCASDVFIRLENIRKSNELRDEICCEISFGSYQFENDQHYRKTYDFPVVLLNKPPTSAVTAAAVSQPEKSSTSEFPLEKKASNVSIIFKMSKNLLFEMMDVKVEFSPQTAYIEDKYLYHLGAAMEETLNLETIRFGEKYLRIDHFVRNENSVPVGDDVWKAARILARPLRWRTLYLGPARITLSVHTSTAFYIALDHSPLQFSEFKRECLNISPYALGQALSVHYFLGAVYGTGWALSSLEFFGSPGGLARSVGAGIADFVSLPIAGVAESGAHGLLTGFAQGSASLTKHVVAGTLSSVTKFAGSWARTLDRFTLDTDDLQQSERLRRDLPCNIGEGIVQGLTEFGISLLGGISGIAHHPLQYATRDEGNRSLINSISLGIAGVITRPLSGAADLVARTGQGILSHVGWNTIPGMRYGTLLDKNAAVCAFQSCPSKYKWCLGLPDVDSLIMTVEAATCEDLPQPLAVILSSAFVYVNQFPADVRCKTFDLRKYDFESDASDPTLVNIFRKEEMPETEETFQERRISKYIKEVNVCMGMPDAQVSEKIYGFYMNPDAKDFFINMIRFAQYSQTTATNA